MVRNLLNAATVGFFAEFLDSGMLMDFRYNLQLL